MLSFCPQNGKSAWTGLAQAAAAALGAGVQCWRAQPLAVLVMSSQAAHWVSWPTKLPPNPAP